jgi:hypothetical protein
LDVSGVWAIFGIACLGGALAELSRWVAFKDSPNLPEYMRTLRYWIITVLVVLAGGGLALCYGVDQPQNAILILNIGASAPLIIKAFVSTVPSKLTPDGGLQAGRAPAPRPETVPRYPANAINFLAGR